MFRKIVVVTGLLSAAVLASAMTLDEAVRHARAHSLQQEGPRIDQEKVNGQIKEAWSNALPQVNGSMAYQRSWKAPVIFFPNPSDGSIMQIKTQQANSALGEASLSQPIYTFGRVGAGLKAAYAGRRAYDHLKSYTEQSLDLDVMKKYLGVLLMKDVVHVRENSLAIADSSFQRVKRLQSVGMMSEYDVLRTEVQVNNLRPQVQEARNNLRLAELAFREVIGAPLDSAVNVEGDLFTLSVEENVESLRFQPDQRNDLAALRDLSTAQQNIYTIYKNAWTPIIGSQVKYQWQWSNDKFAMNPVNNASSFSGGIAIQIPIWSSGAVSGKAQQYKAEWKRAQLNANQAERGAKLQFTAALGNYRTAVESEAAATTASRQASEARTIAQTKLAQGQITPLEMDAAQLDEAVAKVMLAQARYARLIASAETRIAAGLSPYITK